MTTITVVMTAHREGVLCGPSIRSLDAATAEARAAGLEVEPLVVLDRTDAATLAMFEAPRGRGWRVLEGDFGDPALARNLGVSQASGDYVTFLDGDDLWSANWLTAAHAFCASEPERLVVQSEVNLVFGTTRGLWRHVDSEDPDFDRDYLKIGNYWDAMTFAARRLYEAYPFRANALGLGYGHEDWHWNCVTLAAGIAHRPAAGTVHFKRRRARSQLSRCDEADVVIWPNPLTRFDFKEREPPTGGEGCA